MVCAGLLPWRPESLGDGLAALARSELFRREFGELFMDYYLKLKESEWQRYRTFCTEQDLGERPADVTEWEQNEYYDFF